MSEYSWDSGESLPWERDAGGWHAGDTEAWRGDLHFDDWSDTLAGPEFHQLDDDDE